RIRGEVDRLYCRSTASVRTGQAPFAPGAGAPTEGGRLTAFLSEHRLGANRHATLRTRGGCSYRGSGDGRLCCRRTAPVRTGTQPFAPGAGAPTGMRAGASGV